MLKEKIKSDIVLKLSDADVKVFTNDNKHFSAVIVSDVFIDKSLLDRQQMIYDLVGEYITSRELHAFSFKTYTKHEWKDENKN